MKHATNITTSIRAITLSTSLAIAAGCSSEEPIPWPPQDSGELVTYSEDVRDRFIERAEDAGFEASFSPTMRVEATPNLIYYDSQNREIVMPLWEEISPDDRAGFEMYGTVLPNMTGQEFFQETMQWFLIPHELGHYIQNETGQESDDDRYESEFNANEFAVAYWIAEGEEDRVARYVDAVTRINENSGSPIPDRCG